MTATAPEVGTIVGHFIVHDIKGTNEKPLVHNVSYEVAAWRTEIMADVGKYPMKLERYLNKGLACCCEIPGIITHDYTPSLYGGVPFGKRDGSENVGEKSSFVHGKMLTEALLDNNFLFNDEDTYRALAESVLVDLKRSAKLFAEGLMKDINNGQYDRVTSNVVEICRKIAEIERIINGGWVKCHIVGGSNDKIKFF